jgi:hypothetical protein
VITVAITLVLVRHAVGGAGVLTNGGGVSYGGTTTPPGLVVDFPLYVENTGSVPVTLESATLVPVPGFPAPRLVHLGVLAEHNNLLSSALGWPVWKAMSPSSGTWQLRSFRGYVVLPWATRQRRHLGPMPDMVEYGILGTRVNTDYWAAGLRITYLMGGSTYTQTLYQGGADCISPVDIHQPKEVWAFYQKYCAAIDLRANRELEKIAPVG